MGWPGPCSHPLAPYPDVPILPKVERTIRLEQSLDEELTKVADLARTTPSAIIEDALEEFHERHPQYRKRLDTIFEKGEQDG